MKILTFTCICLFSFSACGQKNKDKEMNTTQIKKTMELTTKISNETVKKAVEALQNNDKNTWYSYFTKDAVFTDDGNKLDFKSFLIMPSTIKKSFLALTK